MKNTNLIFLLVTAFLSLSCIMEDTQEYELSPGETIPDFTVTMNDGSTITGEQLRKGVAVIVFFNTECPDCKNTLPSVQKIYDEYSSFSDVSFALISREQDGASIKVYWDSMGYDMPYSAQTDRKIYSLFASSRVPRVYICRKGIVTASYDDSPIPSYENLAADMQSALN